MLSTMFPWLVTGLCWPPLNSICLSTQPRHLESAVPFQILFSGCLGSISKQLWYWFSQFQQYLSEESTQSFTLRRALHSDTSYSQPRVWPSILHLLLLVVLTLASRSQLTRAQGWRHQSTVILTSGVSSPWWSPLQDCVPQSLPFGLFLPVQRPGNSGFLLSASLFSGSWDAYHLMSRAVVFNYFAGQ